MTASYHYPAVPAFAASHAFIHSLSHGARTLDVIRQSATKVPLAPASIQSCSAERSDRERITADSAPKARATALKSTSGISIGFSVSPLRTVLVDLGSVGGVVVNQHDRAAGGTDQRFQVGQAHQEPAVA